MILVHFIQILFIYFVFYFLGFYYHFFYYTYTSHIFYLWNNLFYTILTFLHFQWKNLIIHFYYFIHLLLFSIWLLIIFHSTFLRHLWFPRCSLSSSSLFFFSFIFPQGNLWVLWPPHEFSTHPQGQITPTLLIEIGTVTLRCLLLQWVKAVKTLPTNSSTTLTLT